MCRWLERDPAGYQDGPSLYSYLGSNPMAGTDPYGLQESGSFSGNSIKIGREGIEHVRVDVVWHVHGDGTVTGNVHVTINETRTTEQHKRNRFFYDPETNRFVNEYGTALTDREVDALRQNNRFQKAISHGVTTLKSKRGGKVRLQTFEPGTGARVTRQVSMFMLAALLTLYTASDAVARSPHYARLVSAIKKGSPETANHAAKDIRDLLLDNGMLGLSEGWWALWETEVLPLLYEVPPSPISDSPCRTRN